MSSQTSSQVNIIILLRISSVLQIISLFVLRQVQEATFCHVSDRKYNQSLRTNNDIIWSTEEILKRIIIFTCEEV